MRIALTPVKSPHMHEFVIEFKGYYGDADVYVSDSQSYAVDSLIDSDIVGKLVKAFDAMERYENDPREFPSLIPHWDDEELFLYEVIPYNADMFDQYLRINSYTIFYYDYSGYKFLVTAKKD